MKILEQRNKFVTNCEVASHLKDMQQWQQEDEKKELYRNNHKMSSFETISDNIQRYFAKTPTSIQDVETVKKMVSDELSKYELEKIEKLQLANLLPQNTVNLFAIVEECDSRFSEEQCTEILELIASYFPNNE